MNKYLKYLASGAAIGATALGGLALEKSIRNKLRHNKNIDYYRSNGKTYYDAKDLSLEDVLQHSKPTTIVYKDGTKKVE